jgi:ATP-dependent DNA helicase RecG
VRITPQELVVLSFPGPDRSIRLEDLKQGKAVSRRYRNRRIGEFLKELDLTEGRSTGISKILKVMKGNGSAPPEFETDDDRSYFLIRLPVHPEADLGDSVEAEGLEKTTVETPDQILRMLDEKPDMTLAQVASKIGKSLRAVERASSKLVKVGRLRFVGPKKGGHWEVIEKS